MSNKQERAKQRKRELQQMGIVNIPILRSRNSPYAIGTVKLNSHTMPAGKDWALIPGVSAETGKIVQFAVVGLKEKDDGKEGNDGSGPEVGDTGGGISPSSEKRSHVAEKLHAEESSPVGDN